MRPEFLARLLSSPTRTRQRRDQALAKQTVADAFEQVGKDSVITVEEGKTSETTIIINGKGNKADLQKRIDQIRAQMEQTESGGLRPAAPSERMGDGHERRRTTG
jgi:hypothetical protein